LFSCQSESECEGRTEGEGETNNAKDDISNTTLFLLPVGNTIFDLSEKLLIEAINDLDIREDRPNVCYGKEFCLSERLQDRLFHE